MSAIFTNGFDVYAFVSVIFGGLEATAMAFVSVGETTNLTTGNDVGVNIDAGWPLMADLTQPGPSYNGHYCSVHGRVTLQPSFLVPGDPGPGVAGVTGCV